MKKFNVLILFVLFGCVAFAPVQAGTLTQDYGVNISDDNQYSDGNVLFQLFNKYFAAELASGNFESLYSSSNDLFDARGVDPTTDWTTSGSQLVGAFKVAAFGHDMSMIDTSGNIVASVANIAGTTNINDPDTGITDLSGYQTINIADDLHVNFQLDASLWGTPMYSWSSDPLGNDGLQPNGADGDGEIHMIAFDITDLYNAKYGTNNDSVYMLAWEDMMFGAGADGDYQDFVAIVTNLTPTSTVTPEPATWLIFLTGGAASAVAWRKRRKKAAA